MMQPQQSRCGQAGETRCGPVKIRTAAQIICIIRICWFFGYRIGIYLTVDEPNFFWNIPYWWMHPTISANIIDTLVCTCIVLFCASQNSGRMAVYFCWLIAFILFWVNLSTTIMKRERRVFVFGIPLELIWLFSDVIEVFYIVITYRQFRSMSCKSRSVHALAFAQPDQPVQLIK